MKHWKIALLVFVASLALVACGAKSTPAPVTTGQDSYTSSNLDTSYEGALSARNQLAMGTLRLDGSPQAVTPEQAAQLLPLWQALVSTVRSGTSAQVEVNTLLGQIEAGMTAEQLAAIKEMKLLQTDIQAWAQANGITLGSGGGTPGQGQGLSPEARATRQAQEGRTPGSSGGGASTALLDAVVKYLQSLIP